MGICMRRRCVWVNGLDGKCHVPCMAGASVQAESAKLRNQILCKRLHSRLRKARLEALGRTPEEPEKTPHRLPEIPEEAEL